MRMTWVTAILFAAGIVCIGAGLWAIEHEAPPVVWLGCLISGITVAWTATYIATKP